MRPIVVRDEEPPDDTVVVVRGGEMNGDTVRRTATDAFDEFGIYTVSVFLALDATVDDLCRDRPELQRYGKVRLTTAGRLRSAGLRTRADARPSALRRGPAGPHRRNA